jgi:hypothetical protein
MKKVVITLLLLVAISSSSFFTLVRSHLMSFSFFTTWHSAMSFKLIKSSFESFAKQ